MKSELAQRALELYGGAELWTASRAIGAEVSTKGWAFVLKGRPFFRHARLIMAIDRPFCRITPIGGSDGVSGVLDGTDVRLERPTGEVIAERKRARGHFTVGRRLFYWDDLDMAYFANYAFWNYFTFPALLMNRDIIWTESTATMLQAVFPDSIPTHSKVQRFHFDPQSGLLARHDYTAEIISRFAKAANVVLKHDRIDGLLFPSRRRVTPRRAANSAMNRPVLIDIEVHDFKLTSTPGL